MKMRHLVVLFSCVLAACSTSMPGSKKVDEAGKKAMLARRNPLLLMAINAN